MQLLRTINVAFPGHGFDDDSETADCDLGSSLDNIEEVRCDWLRASGLVHDFLNTGQVTSDIEPALLRFSRGAQGVMSRTASNYDVSRLYVGLCVGAIAVFLSTWSTYELLWKWPSPGAYFMLSILGYGTMMFASSYVEEEQQFWYWVFTGWIFYIHARSSGRPGEQNVVHMAAVGLAVFHRMLRRWNQTGQKLAGEPDIASSFLRFHPNILWALVALTYLGICVRISVCLPTGLIWRLFAFLVSVSAFTFKLAFVASESPELLNSPSMLKYTKGLVDTIPLILQARLVFGAIFLLAILSLYLTRYKRGYLRGKCDLSLFFFFCLSLFALLL